MKTNLQAGESVVSTPSEECAPEREFERELAETETRTRTVLDTLLDGVITIGERGVIESVNTAATTISWRIDDASGAELASGSTSTDIPSTASTTDTFFGMACRNLSASAGVARVGTAWMYLGTGKDTY